MGNNLRDERKVVGKFNEKEFIMNNSSQKTNGGKNWKK